MGFLFTAFMGGSGSPATNVPTLARRWDLSPKRSVLLIGGAAFSCVLPILMAWVDGLGWPVRSIALAAIGAGALLRLIRPVGRHLGEGLAGHGSMLLGIAYLGSGFRDCSELLRLEDAGSSLATVLAYVAAGGLSAIALRSPGVTIAVAVQGAAGGVIGVHSAAAMLIGAGVISPWWTVRVGWFGDVEDGVMAVLHATFASILTLFSGLLFPWLTSLPTILEPSPGVPHVTLLAFVLVGTSAAVLAMVVVAEPLDRSARRYLSARRHAARVAFVHHLADSTTPTLAVEALSANLDAAVCEVRRVAHARLCDDSLSKARWHDALSVGDQTLASMEALKSRLDATRWAAPQLESALAAVRAAGACQRLIRGLVALKVPKLAHEQLQHDLALTVEGLWNLIEACTRMEEIPLLDGVLTAQGELELQLVSLRYRAAACCEDLRVAAEASVYASRVRSLVRATCGLAEARAEETPGDFVPVEANESEVVTSTDAVEPESVLPRGRKGAGDRRGAAQSSQLTFVETGETFDVQG
jgi:hypothetical protein